jgi:hypothetical protein
MEGYIALQMPQSPRLISCGYFGETQLHEAVSISGLSARREQEGIITIHSHHCRTIRVHD